MLLSLVQSGAQIKSPVDLSDVVVPIPTCFVARVLVSLQVVRFVKIQDKILVWIRQGNSNRLFVKLKFAVDGGVISFALCSLYFSRKLLRSPRSIKKSPSKFTRRWMRPQNFTSQRLCLGDLDVLGRFGWVGPPQAMSRAAFAIWAGEWVYAGRC